MFSLPFRWSLANRSALGGLAHGERAPTYEGFQDDLLACCSRVLALGGDSDLVFVGRSPESVFDHLSGLLLDTSWASRLALLQFSMRFSTPHEITEQNPVAFPAMREYLSSLSLHPQGLIQRPRPVALVDLVATGATFGNMVRLLHGWAREEGTDWSAARRKLRLVGITSRVKNSPNTRRWAQHADWLPLLPRRAAKSVSVAPHFWDYMGNWGQKVTRSYHWRFWGSEENSCPFHGEPHLQALRLALDLFESGAKREGRLAFAALLAREPAMRHEWFRSLAHELKG